MNDISFCNERLAAIYKKVRQKTLQICKPLETEDYAIQPASFVSPPKWHLAHTSWFFEEFILKELSGFSYYNKHYCLLFNSYYKALGPHWLQKDRGTLSRPTLKAIEAYRFAIDQQIEAFIAEEKANARLLSRLWVGLHHEQQHQELLYMDIKYILALNETEAAYKALNPAKTKTGAEHWLSFDEGLCDIGHDESSFAFDNERPSHRVYLYPFMISDVLVSNGDYLAFINAGAYCAPEYWLSLGWEWLLKENITQPLYWKKIGDDWYEYTLYGLEKLDLNAPLTHISYFEADAYARFRGARLPSEFEFEVFLRSKEREPNHESLHPHSLSAARGQVWCWTKSPYTPYPRFKPFREALSEYNGKFMCNQMVLRGASVVTPEGHHRDSYRNFYAPEQRWMFSGIRLAKDLP